MSGRIINDLKMETDACEREYNYWKKQADILNAKANAETDVAVAMCYFAEAANCEVFAEQALSFLEHLKAVTNNAKEVL